MSDTVINIKNEIKKSEILRNICLKEISDLPNGKLNFTLSRGNRYYYKIASGKREYIGRENEEVRQILKRNFYEQYLKILTNNISHLRNALDHIIGTDPQTITNMCKGAYSNVPAECYTRLGYKPTPGSGVNESQNNYHLEGLKHLAPSGIYMRSKSEVLISGVYSRLDVICEYEKPLYLNNHDIIYPDFTIVSKDGRRFLYHEHCGMMKDPDYRKAFFAKLNKYIDNDYIPFRDVLFTFDESDGSLDLVAIENMLVYFLDNDFV